MARPLAEIVRLSEVEERRGAAGRSRGRIRRRRVTTGLVLSAVLVGGWGLVQSPLFALDGIQIAGTHLLSREDVLRASGLRIGMSVLSVKTDAVASQLERLALVRDATVSRVYPSKVRIVIAERLPVAIVDTDWGLWLVDGGGEIIARPPAAPLGVPRIRIVAAPRSDGVAEAIRLLVALPDAERAAVSEIQATDPTALTAVMHGLRVVFGSPDDVSVKLRALALVSARARAEARTLVQVDVRSPARPAARFA